jgi:RimJ/RimL family protein N-acetyltransferase
MLIQHEITIPGDGAKPELYLRPIVEDDLSTLTPYDPKIADFIPQKYVDISMGLCSGDAEAITALETEQDAAYWGIFSAKEERMVGFTGLHSIVEENGREVHSRGIGIVLNSQDFGMGIASRTHPYRSRHGFVDRDLAYISGKAVEANKGSLRAVKRAGYVALGPTEFPGMEGVPAVLVRQYNPDRFTMDEAVEAASKTAAETGYDLNVADVETAYEITRQNLARLCLLLQD